MAKQDKKENLLEALKTVITEKNMDDETVIRILKESLISAAKKYLDIDKRIEVDIDTETNEVHVFLRVEVVDDFPDYEIDPNMDRDEAAKELAKFDEGYMLVDEALDYTEDAKAGLFLEMEVPIEAFGRQAIQNAKQLLMQNMRDAERARIKSIFASRVGTLISGEVMRLEGPNIIINLGATEAILPVKEQIRKEKWSQGDSVKAVILKIDENAKVGSPMVILSRTSPKFLKALFRQEVPEIFDGSVEIKNVVRDPGFRAKLAVYARDEHIDPVGACVGMKGARVQAIVRELANERVDIVVWNEDSEVYIRRALAPANIIKLIEVPNSHRTVTIIADEDLAQAIGKNGQNVRLASMLVERNLDVFGENEWMAKSEEEKAKITHPTNRDVKEYMSTQTRTVKSDSVEAQPVEESAKVEE